MNRAHVQEKVIATVQTVIRHFLTSSHRGRRGRAAANGRSQECGSSSCSCLRRGAGLFDEQLQGSEADSSLTMVTFGHEVRGYPRKSASDGA